MRQGPSHRNCRRWDGLSIQARVRRIRQKDAGHPSYWPEKRQKRWAWLVPAA